MPASYRVDEPIHRRHLFGVGCSPSACIHPCPAAPVTPLPGCHSYRIYGSPAWRRWRSPLLAARRSRSVTWLAARIPAAYPRPASPIARQRRFGAYRGGAQELTVATMSGSCAVFYSQRPRIDKGSQRNNLLLGRAVLWIARAAPAWWSRATPPALPGSRAADSPDVNCCSCDLWTGDSQRCGGLLLPFHLSSILQADQVDVQVI